ncbi:Uncharacterized protein FWK35_00012177, partial [Aphis craccivora]
IRFMYNSERSDECIDFTMVCFFFLSVYSITSRNNAPISNYGGGLGCKNEYPWCIIGIKNKHIPTVFKKIEKNKKKNDGKTGIFMQNQFSTKSIFLYGCNSKTNHCKYLKFSPNVYVSVTYIQLNFQKILTFLMSIKKFWLSKNSNFYEICRKRENLQRNDNDLTSNDFKFAFSLRTIFLLAFELRVENAIRDFPYYNLNSGIFGPLQHKPPFSPTTGNYILG